jgi:hypothetical protein
VGTNRVIESSSHRACDERASIVASSICARRDYEMHCTRTRCSPLDWITVAPPLLTEARIGSSCYAREVFHLRLANVGFAVVALAFAHVLACSYDWNIGTGSPIGESPQTSSGPDGGAAKPPGTPPPPDGGARDASTGATNGECGATCECKDNQNCSFTCTTGTCNLKCSNSSNCQLTCAPGATCNTTCQDKSDCNLDCKAGRSSCSLKCEDDADCRADCSLASLCLRNCEKDCDVNCSNGGICPR